MESKRKNVYIVIFVITTIVAGAIAVYFGIDANKSKQELEKQVAKVEENLAKNENNATKTEVQQVEKVVEKGVFASIDVNKCLNKKDNIVYSDSARYSFNGISCSRNEDKKSALLAFDPKTIETMYNFRMGTSQYQNINISGFSGEIADIYIGGFGQAVGNEVILFLMKDGTVEYMPLQEALKNNNVKSYGKVKGVSGIVRIANINSGVVEGGGWATTVAIKADGSFYDLLNDSLVGISF